MVVNDKTNPELCRLIGERADIMERIWNHYDHARRKHPRFCDRHTPAHDAADPRIMLRVLRRAIADETRRGELCWETLLDCEVYEALEAVADGDDAHAVEELYDAIAVLLRVIDALEGRQPLGEPKGGAE